MEKKKVSSIVNQAVQARIKFPWAINTIKTFSLIYFIKDALTVNNVNYIYCYGNFSILLLY